jgi:ubiquinone/menaquinone biosynthesis C-methylase UbiE
MKKYLMKNTDYHTLTQKEIIVAYDALFKEQSRLRDTDSFYAWVLNRLSPSAGTSLIDIACGAGLLVHNARRKGIHAVGIDLSKEGALQANMRLGEAVISVANGECLPFDDQSFDFVTNIGSLEHFLNPVKGISEMVRVLKQNGKAAIVLPNSYYLVDILWQTWRTGYSANHKQPLERFASMREWWDFLEKDGLKVRRVYKYNFCFPRSRADLQWYREHPKRIFNLLVSPLIPLNLSYHFLFICTKS